MINLLSLALNESWLMEPSALSDMMNVLHLREYDREEYLKLQSEYELAKPNKNKNYLAYQLGRMIDENGILQYSIDSKLIPKGSSIESYSGTQSYQGIRTVLKEAAANPSVKGVFLNMDSPGGSITGLRETAAELKALAAIKPVIAYTSSGSYSASEWLRTTVSKSFGAPSAEFGSIGVWSAHQDMSAKLEKEGIKLTLIQAGKYKLEGSPFAPPSDRFLKNTKQEVDSIYQDFKQTIASNRNLDIQTADDIELENKMLQDGWAEGKIFNATQAKDIGLIDEIGTEDQAYDYLLSLIDGKSLIDTGQSASTQASVSSITPNQLHSMPKPELKNIEDAASKIEALESQLASAQDESKNLREELSTLKTEKEAREKQDKSNLIAQLEELKSLTPTEKALYEKCTSTELGSILKETREANESNLGTATLPPPPKGEQPSANTLTESKPPVVTKVFVGAVNQDPKEEEKPVLGAGFYEAFNQ